MAQMSAPMSSRTNTARARAAARREGTVSRLAEPETMSVTAYLLQGSAFIGFLLVLFVLAGFRG